MFYSQPNRYVAQSLLPPSLTVLLRPPRPHRGPAACPDRGLRRSLLESIDQYAQHLTTAVIEDMIYPQLQTGFTDTHAYIRELTLKSMLALAPKLTNKTLVTSVLKHLSKLQVGRKGPAFVSRCWRCDRAGGVSFPPPPLCFFSRHASTRVATAEPEWLSRLQVGCRGCRRSLMRARGKIFAG